MSDHTPATEAGPDDEQAVSTPPGVPAQDGRDQPGLAGDTGLRDETAADSAEDAHGGTIPVEDEQPDPSPASERSEETPEQRENTEASTEQPSQ